jgi:hypothetical protein
MMKRALIGAALAASLAAPALALEHEVVIEHPAGTIAADYSGAVTIETRQVGAAGVAGRSSTLACEWTATLNVERTAKLGQALQTRRTLSRDDVARGTKPGWCETQTKAIDALVAARRDTFRTAMLELVEQDRSAIVAEADGVRRREG